MNKAVAPLNLTYENQSATYEFTLYSNPSYVLTANDTDGSLSVRAYLTINYTTRNTPTEYLLTGVSGYWNILDSSVSVTSAKLVYGCSGSFPFSMTQSATKAVGNYFSYNTGFTKYTIQDRGSMGANLTLNLKMGTTRTWQFYMTNKLF